MNCIEWIKQVLACVMAGHIFPTPYHTQRWILYRMHHNLAEGEFPQLSEERWNHLRVRGGRLALRPGALTPNPQWFQENCLVCGEPAQAGTGLVPRYLWIEFQTLEPVWGEGDWQMGVIVLKQRTLCWFHGHCYNSLDGNGGLLSDSAGYTQRCMGA